jgi:hypothetical protein
MLPLTLLKQAKTANRPFSDALTRALRNFSLFVALAALDVPDR